MEKTIELWKKLWYYDKNIVVWKQLWWYIKSYGTLIYYGGKLTMVLWKPYHSFINGLLLRRIRLILEWSAKYLQLWTVCISDFAITVFTRPWGNFNLNNLTSYRRLNIHTYISNLIITEVKVKTSLPVKNHCTFFCCK